MNFHYPLISTDFTLQGAPTDMIPFLLPLLATIPSPASGFETWCGKYYEIGSPQTPPSPESRFSYPTHGDQKLLDFKCLTASSIYLPGDDVLDPPGMIFDAEISYDVGQPRTSLRNQAHRYVGDVKAGGERH